MGGISDIVGSVTGGVLGTDFKTIAPTAVPESFGGQALAEAIGQGAEIQGQSIQDAIAQQQASLGQAGELFGQTAGQFDPFIQGGGAASQQQAALSGALGPQAQQQAFSQFQASPGQQFLQQQGEKALLRNAAVTGQLGGGRAQQALQQQGIGFAQQDFANQFGRLGQVAQQGLGATQALGGLRQGFAQQGLGAGQNIGNLLTQEGAVQAGGLTGAADALRQEQLQQFDAANIARGQEASNLAAQQAAAGQGVSNLVGLGTLAFSDIKLKSNVKKVGTVKGVNFYSWTWNKLASSLGLIGREFGVLAQELEKSHPQFVFNGEYKMIDKLGLFNSLEAA